MGKTTPKCSVAAASANAITSGSGKHILISRPGVTHYAESYQSMVNAANERNQDDADVIWLLEHHPVYTQGTACKLDTFLPTDIPVVKTDRGGQITYHGPGQIVMYPLISLKRYGIGVKSLVAALEDSVIATLQEFGVTGERRENAPGVYVENAKIAALGLRIRRGTSYHGLSLNVDMDLEPFKNIDPCGYEGLDVTQLSDLSDSEVSPGAVGERLLANFVALI